MTTKTNKKGGFSLVELLVVIAIIGIIAVLSFPSIRNYRTSVEVETSSDEVQNALRQAQSESMTVKDEIEHGVHFDEISGEFVVFSGAAFNPVDPENLVYGLNDQTEFINVSFQNLDNQTVIFQKLSGSTDNYGSLSIRSIRDNSVISTITVTTEGKITL